MENRVVFIELGEFAEGSIEPREDQMELLEEVTQRIGSGEFHVATELRLPCGCIDGRCGCTLKPNSAGGTESLMVADDLTTKNFDVDGTTAGAYEAVLTMLNQRGEEVGGHDDQHSSEQKSGCGANDRLKEIYEIITKRADSIQAIAAAIGVEVDNEIHTQIIKNASDRTTFSPGTELLESLKAHGEDNVDHLVGEHNEVLAVINYRFGTTLDRDAVRAEFGPNYDAFNIDAWAFEAGAEAVSKDVSEVPAKVAAMAYYNIGTSLVLGGKKLRVVVLR